MWRWVLHLPPPSPPPASARRRWQTPPAAAGPARRRLGQAAQGGLRGRELLRGHPLAPVCEGQAAAILGRPGPTARGRAAQAAVAQATAAACLHSPGRGRVMCRAPPTGRRMWSCSQVPMPAISVCRSSSHACSLASRWLSCAGGRRGGCAAVGVQPAGPRSRRSSGGRPGLRWACVEGLRQGGWLRHSQAAALVLHPWQELWRSQANFASPLSSLTPGRKSCMRCSQAWVRDGSSGLRRWWRCSASAWKYRPNTAAGDGGGDFFCWRQRAFEQGPLPSGAGHVVSQQTAEAAQPAGGLGGLEQQRQRRRHQPSRTGAPQLLLGCHADLVAVATCGSWEGAGWRSRGRAVGRDGLTACMGTAGARMHSPQLSRPCRHYHPSIHAASVAI